MRTFFILLLSPLLAYTQQRDFSSCENTLSVLLGGEYSVSFLGKKGAVPSEGVFQHAKNPGKNQIWMDFTTSQKGRLNISFLHQNQAIQLLILNNIFPNLINGNRIFKPIYKESIRSMFY